MASVNGRFLSSSSQILLYAVAVVVALVALFSFALSFNALAVLAEDSHVPRQIAWAWPVVVDLSIIVGTFASLVLRGRSSRAVRVYPWLILVFFGLVSILGNGYHALTGGAPATPPIAFAVGAVPAIALLASTHLLVVMLTSPTEAVTDEQIVRDTKKAARVQPATVPKPAPATKRRQPPAPKPLTPAARPVAPAVNETRAQPPVALLPAPVVLELPATVPVVEPETLPSASASAPAPVTRASVGRSGSMTREQAEKKVLRQWKETGEWMSGPAAGDLMGVSRKTGARLVAGLRAANDPAASTEA